MLDTDPSPEVDLDHQPASKWMMMMLGWLGLFAAVTLVKWSAIGVPSSWDESWAVLPAGVWLADNSFAIQDLLALPDWRNGGPSSKALSPVTWIAALVAYFTDADSFLPTLHIVHFAIAAVVLQQVYLFARSAWPRASSAVLVLATAALPSVNAQFGAVYMELPMLATGLLSINAALRGRWKTAAVWGLVATLIKPSGIILIAGLVTAMYITKRLSLTRCLAIIGVAGLGFLANIEGTGTNRDRINVIESSLNTFSLVPVITISMLIALALGTRTALLRRDQPGAQRVIIANASFLAFLGFYISVIWLIIPIFILPRYLIQIAPFALFAGAEVLRWHYPAALRRALVALVIVFSVLNLNGNIWLNQDSENSVVQEMSNRHVQLLLLTEEMFAYAQAQPESTVYMEPNLWFRSQIPELGYVDAPLPGATALDQDIGNRLESLPDAFVVLDSEASGFAEDFLELLEASPDFTYTETVIVRDLFDARYVRFTRK